MTHGERQRVQRCAEYGWGGDTEQLLRLKQECHDLACATSRLLAT